MFPFRPFRHDSCLLSPEDERGYLFYKYKSDEEKKMRRLLCPESKGNAETFAIIPLYDVVSELLIESRNEVGFDE